MRKKRRYLLETQGYRCFYCACHLDFEDATVDHLTPQSLGGKDNVENLAAACAPCNSRRGNRSVREMLVMTAPLALHGGSILNIEPAPHKFKLFSALSRALISVWEGVKKMVHTLHWSRVPGKFVNKLTGQPVVLSSSLSGKLVGPVFTGSIGEWYECLVETMVDAVNGAMPGVDEVDVYVSADVNCILEASVLYRPRFTNSETFETSGGTFQGHEGGEEFFIKSTGETIVSTKRATMNVWIDQNTQRNKMVIKDPKSDRMAIVIILDIPE